MITEGMGKRTRVCVAGLPYFVQLLSHLLSSPDLCFEPCSRRYVRALLQCQQARAIYFISGSITSSRLARLGLFLRKPVIMHWVGTDVLDAIAASRAGRHSRWLADRCIHWAEVPWIVKELEVIGIRAQVVPLTVPALPTEVPELPREFRILTYIGSKRGDHYGLAHVIQLAKDFPDVLVTVVGESGLCTGDLPPNIILAGHVDHMSAQYGEASVVVRMTRHDGLSFMVLEGLAHGRHVIWTYPFGGVLHATNYIELQTHVEGLLALHKERNLQINRVGVDFVQREYEPARVAANLRSQMRRAIKGERDAARSSV